MSNTSAFIVQQPEDKLQVQKKTQKAKNNYLENEPLTALGAVVTLVDVGEDRPVVRSRVLYRRAEHSLTASPQGQN